MKEKIKSRKNDKDYIIYQNSQKGITLIALVITIVILIILATVAINATFGENGLIKSAEDAKKMQEEAAENEMSEISKYEDIINKYVGTEIDESEPGLYPSGTNIFDSSMSMSMSMSMSVSSLTFTSSYYTWDELIENKYIYVQDNVITNVSSILYGKLVIPDTIIGIEGSAFRECVGLTSIVLPNSVKSIGEYTFHKCVSLTSINIPDGVTSIGDNAFSYCESLTSVNIPNSVTNIGRGAFRFCSSLTNINIPNGITSIENYVFNDCKSLTSIVLPDSVTSIGEFAFWFCTSLKSINIPDSVINIEHGAFSNCETLTISWNSKTYTYENKQQLINDLKAESITVADFIW